jgi:hypothetical protein
MAHIGGRHLLKLRVDALAGESLVVGRDYSFGKTLADRRGIRIHGVEQNLHGDGTSAMQIARVVVRNYKSGIEGSVGDHLAHFVDGQICAGGLEAFALCHVGDEFAALGSAAIVNHAELQIADSGVERETEKKQLQRRWQNQRHREALVAQNLAKFFADESPHAVAEKCLKFSHRLVFQLHSAHVPPGKDVKSGADSSDDKNF